MGKPPRWWYVSDSEWRVLFFVLFSLPAPQPPFSLDVHVLQLAGHFLLSVKMFTRSLSAVLLWDFPVGGSWEIWNPGKTPLLWPVATKQVSGLRFEDSRSGARRLGAHCSLRPQPSRLAWQRSRPDCIINANGAASWSEALRVYFCATLTQEY